MKTSAAPPKPAPSAEPFRRLLEGLDAIAVQGYDHERRVFFWNDASVRLYGWTREEALGRRLEDLIIPAFMREGVVAAVQEWLGRGAFSMPAEELELLHKDGSLVPVLSSHTMQIAADGRAEMYCVDIDLRPRREAEAARARAQERLQRALDGANDGIWDWDLVQGSVYYSPRFHQLLGHSDEAAFLAEFSFRGHLHPDDHDRAVRALEHHLHEDGPPFDCDYRLRCADGSWRWFRGRGRASRDDQGRVLRFAGAITDITERMLAEQAVRASEERFRTLSELSADWYWQTDADHRFIEVVGGQRDAERAPVHYLGLRRWEVPSEGVSAEQWAAHRATIERREPFRDFVVHRRDALGALLVFSSSGRPRYDAAGQFLGYEGVGRNLTDLHLARVREEELQSRLREAQKLEALGTLAGGIAHDFNNVLGAMLGGLAMASEDAAAGLPVVDRLQQLTQAAHRARELVQQILAFSRRRQPELQVLPLQPLLQEVQNLLRATLPAGVRLEAKWPAEPLFAQIDAGQIHQVLMNLGVNAWHALGAVPGTAGRHGAADARTAEPVVELGLAAGPEPAQLQLWVQDNGCGMDEATLRRAFEPFFTTKAVGQGTGLGLSVAHGVVTAHGGRIDVRSVPGQGSRFTLVLPRVAEAEVPPPPAADPVAVPALATRRRVLLVDDDDVVRLVSQEMLQRAGYAVSSHADGASALLALQAAPDQFELMVTDHNMPGLSGQQLAAAASRLVPGLPVLLTSGYLEDSVRAAALSSGVAGVMHKEHMADELVRRVGELLAARDPAGRGTAPS